MSELITGSLQENLLTLAVFDTSSLPLLTSTLEVGMFENDFYRNIIREAFQYYKEFKQAPGEHISDLFETHLTRKASEKEANVYERILQQLFHNKDNVNRDYVLSQLNKFIRQATLKDGITAAHQLVKDGKLDEAETKLSESIHSQIKIFEPGLWLTDTQQSLKFLTSPVQPYPLGIKPLDDIGFGPAPGQLLVILAAPNRGKSQFCVHIAKMCAMQRLKVLYISLEMSEEKIAQRFFQSLFAVTKRQGEVIYTKFDKDELDRLSGLRIESLQRPSLKDEGIEEALRQKMAQFKNRFKIYIKRFPTNALSIKGLESYLDGMERFYNFVPDVLLVDYADLLQLDANNLRIATGGVYKDLRRIGVERNFAVVSPSQANRLSEDAKVISLKFLAEDYSKAAIADDVVAYCQSSLELRLGLARLFVAKARDEEREQTILISQSYKMAQFCVDATQISDRYWSLLDAHNNPNEPTPPEAPIARTPIKRRNIR